MSNQSEDEPSLDALSQKITAMKSERQEDATTPTERSRLGKTMHMATEFFAAVGVGGFMGYWLDHWLESSPIFLILMFLIGFAAGVRNMLRNV